MEYFLSRRLIQPTNQTHSKVKLPSPMERYLSLQPKVDALSVCRNHASLCLNLFPSSPCGHASRVSDIGVDSLGMLSFHPQCFSHTTADLLIRSDHGKLWKKNGVVFGQQRWLDLAALASCERLTTRNDAWRRT